MDTGAAVLLIAGLGRVAEENGWPPPAEAGALEGR
jgi:hypothetical protein